MHSDVVNDVSYAGLVMRGDILGLERRRRWCDEEKLKIVLSVGVGGATVTQVSQWHDVTRQQICAWRHELTKKGLLTALPGALFLPVEVVLLPIFHGMDVSRMRRKKHIVGDVCCLR